MGGQPLDLPADGLVLGFHLCQPLIRNQSDPMPDGAQALVGVVLTQQQTVLAAAGHHAVGLIGALGDQIVDEGADIGLSPRKDQRLLAFQRQGGVDPRSKALDRRLLIARGPAELSRAVKGGNFFALQSGTQFQRIDAVVLDGVGGAHHLRPLQTGDGVEHSQLDLLRHSGGEALDI